MPMLIMKMKRRILIYSIYLFVFIIIGNNGWGQSVEIRNNVFNTGIYSKGASITVPLKFNGCFDTLNQIKLYLSDASGNFNNGGTLIGSHSNFFSAFVNGNIPSSTPNGNGYKIRVETTNPVKADTSSAFSINAGFTQIQNPTVVLPSSGHQINDSTFGNCVANAPSSAIGLNLNISSLQGGTLSTKLFDSSFNLLTSNVNGSTVIVYPVIGNYYTLEITLTNASNVITKRSFLLYYNTHQLSLQNDGITEKCFPVTQQYSINILGSDGIKNNYPGTIYKINWGDNTSTSYSHCQIIAMNGVVTHDYNSSSCGKPPLSTNSGTQYNAFQISLSAKNKFCSNFADLNTYLKVFKKPVANFSYINPQCVNTSVTFTNTSETGPAAPSNSQNCTISNLSYYWFVDGTFKSSSANYTTSFSSPGIYTIKLVVENAGTPCSGEITKTICIQPPATVSFKVNGLDSVVGCAPIVVNTTNTTTEGTCSPPTYSWQALFESTGLPAPMSNYSISSGTLTSKELSFVFNTPGRYLLKLSATNSCGTLSLTKKVVILGITDAALPSAKSYCSTPKIINFGSNPSHIPTFSSSGNASDTYSWSVVGGSFSFVNGTSSSSQYPQIQFNQNVTYTVSLLFTNSCGNKTTSQVITFNQPVTADAGIDTTICYNLTSFSLLGNPTGPSGFTVGWSGGGGSFSSSTSSNTTYSVSQNDRNAGTINLTYTVIPPAGSVCPSVSDSRTITIRPENKINSTLTKIICSGTSVNYLPTSNQLPSSFSWTSTVSTGTVTGNTNGTGTINDVLINASLTTDAVVTYTITPSKDGCNGTPATFTVTVKPQPNISSNSFTNPTSCGGNNGSITLNGLTPNTSFYISFSKNGAATSSINATSNASGQVIITGLTAGTYSNISVSLAPNVCVSNMVGPIVLTEPNAPNAPTASSNSPICSGNTLNLTATSSTSGVTFKWSGPNGFTSTNQNPSITNVSSSASGTYSVTVTLVGCTSAATNVVVVVSQTPSTPIVSTPVEYCQNAVATPLNVTATSGNELQWYSTATGGTASSITPTPSTTTVGNVTYYVSQKNNSSSCESPRTPIVVTVKPTPNISGYTKTNPTQCASTTGSITLSGLTNGQQYVVNFIKNGVAQSPQTITANGGNVVISNLSAGTYTNITVTLNGCISNIIAGPIVLTDPNPPSTPVATSNGPICSGNNLNLISNTSTSGVIQFNWTGPNGFTSANQNPTITSATTAASGTYSVTATLNSCVSAAGTIIVVVDSTPIAPSINSNSPLCYGNNLTFTTTINFPTTLTYAWTGPNGFTSSLQNPTIPSATELASGTYSLLITANAGNCSPGAVNTSVIVRPLLTQAHIAGLDTVFVCNFNPPANATQSLSANLNATRPFESGKWTIISQPSGSTANFANDNSPNTTITYNKSGLYQLQWTISNDANCPSTKDTVFLSIVDKPQITQELSASSINVCAGNPVTISIPNNQVIGTISKWQYKRPYNNQLWKDTLVTNPTITFNNVQDTFTVRLVVIATDQIHCSSDTAFKEITINVAPPSYPGITIGADTVCQGSNSGTIILTSNIGAPTWQSSTNGINFSNIPNSAVQNYTYNNLTVTTWFRAAVKSGVCDTVFSNPTKITVYPPVSIANAGADVELCGDSTYQLNANAPSSIETGVWSFASGSATATIHSPNAANTIISNLMPNTNYRLVWTLSNGICPATTDEVEIRNYLPLTNTIDTSTITVCNSSVVNITGNSPIGGNTPYLYQWQILQGGIWVNIPGATSMSYSFTADSTVKIRRQVTALPCINFSLEKTIYVQPPLANNTISGNNETCINTSSGVLIGSLPIGADGNYFYQWQILQGSSWIDIPTATQKDFTVPILTVSTTYRRLVTSALCSGNQGLYSLPFVITVRPDAKAIWTITIDTACAPFNINNSIVSPVHQPLSNGSYSWYANNVFYGNNATQNPGYILNNAGDSVTIKMVAVSLYGCKNDSVQHKFFTIPPVLTNFVLSDSIGCGPLSVTITNTTPYLGFFNYAWNFGNQQTSNLSQPGTIIFQSNPNFTDTTYYVSLTATSKCEVDTKTKTVTVKSKPKSIFTPDKTIGCSPLLINFTNISKGVGASYIWDFGDGTQQAIGTSQSVSHTYNTSVQDTFKVKLISINQCGTDTAVYNIVVAPSTLKLDFAVNGTEKQGCKPHSVKFINASSGASSFHWSFGDGNTLNTTKNIDTVNHTFIQSGSFTVTLFATNGCTDTSATEIIQVFNPPTANFSATPLQACIGDTIYFHNQSDTTTSLLWNFKDGYTSSATNPVHAFTTPGVYNVQLKAIRQYNSGLACTDSIIKPITIVSKLPGTFTVTDTISNCVPFTATFTNQTFPSSLTIWNFGPGINDTGNVVTHTFTQVGTYLVKMNVTHPGGCNYEATKEIKVIAPFGTFTYDKGIICGNTPLKFEVNAQNTDSIKWNFGDGNILTTSNPIVYHSYQQPGNFLPTATLIKNGCSVLLKGIDTIKVDYINAGFKYNSVQTCGNTKIQFIDTSRKYQPIASWLWNFGDGTYSSLQNPIKNYSASNSWQIKLIVTSITGCSDTITKNIFIKVNTNPSANINATVTACTDRPVKYEAQIVSADTISIINWSFSNGVVLTGSPVNNYYINTGTYNATLIVGTLYGCQDTVTKSITINQSPTITASADVTICKGQSNQLNVTGTTSYSWAPLNGTLSCINCANPIATPLSTTQYVVTGSNSFGCTDIDTVVITVAQPIKLTVSTNDTICIGQSSQLSVTGATTYIWSPGATLNNTTTAFPIATPTLTTKYRVIGFDSHNCFQDTAYIVVAVGQYPTVNLGTDKVLATGTPLPLVTTITNGPITKWTWGPSAATLSCNDCATPIATIKRDMCYTVEVSNLYKCTARDTMCVKVFCENSQVFIPNAFTPDGDGVNDVLVVRAQGISVIKNFRIFNRWGQVVFEKNNFAPNDVNAGWDGKINGKLATADVYVYTCDVICENDISYTYKGNISIIR